MRKRKYEVWNPGGKLASDMTLEDALLFIEVLCNKYCNELADYQIREIDLEIVRCREG